MNPGVNRSWIAYESKTPIQVARIVVVQYGNRGNYISSFQLQYSDDGRTWSTLFTAKRVPQDKYDSAKDSSLDLPQPKVKVQKSPVQQPLSQNVEEHSSQSAYLKVQVVEEYKPYISGGPRVKVWMGDTVAIIVDEKAMTDFCPQDDRIMEIIVKNIEKMIAKFDEIVGKKPALTNPFNNRIRYEVAFLSRAAGLAHHGSAGIATGPIYIKGMYDKAAKGKQTIDHIFFYETTRNYIFPEFSAVLDYHFQEGRQSYGWVNQGFVNVLGCLFANELQVDFYYYGQSREQFMDNMEEHLFTYINGKQYTWENTWYERSLLPWNRGASVDNLFSGLLVHLYKHHGGTAFLKRWFQGLSLLLDRRPSSRSDSEKARENFYILSCYSARQNLTEFFEGQLRWPLSHDAKNLGEIYSQQ